MSHCTQDTMKRVLIVCYGNPLRRDDGISWYVADRLENLTQYYEERGVKLKVERYIELLPELLETLRDFDTVVFVDAAVDIDSPAKIEELEFDSVEVVGMPYSSHGLSPPIILKLYEELHGTPPETYVMKIRACDLSLGQGFTDEAIEGARTAIQLLEWLIDDNRDSR